MKNILCFGDSNTWGYNPQNGERFPENVRWTSRLQSHLEKEYVVIEEGLCGRTTVYEDAYRPNRKGVDSLKLIFENNDKIDAVVIMLGTNDCKTCYHCTPKDIAEGISQCIEYILNYVAPENVLLISPIHLGKDVWKEGFDPEFNTYSVDVSKGLQSEYEKIAQKNNLHFIAASDYVHPSATDQEHLDEEGHKVLAEVIYNQISKMNRKLDIQKVAGLK